MKMKTKILILSSVISFFCAALLISCGHDDNVVNPPVNDVIFTEDSISLWVTSPNQLGMDSSVFSLGDNTLTKVKLEFEVISNSNGVNGTGRFYVLSNVSPLLPLEDTLRAVTDISYTYVADVSSQPLYAIYHLNMLTGSGSSIPYYIKLKNVKITRQ
jgi:hypothetical protein